MRCVFSRPRLNWARVLGVFCIALVLMSGLVQAAHMHADGQDHDCALCVAAHHVSCAAPAVTLDCASVPVIALIAAQSVRVPPRAVFFRLASRPPPQGSAFSA
jgi:hypothetical protein